MDKKLVVIYNASEGNEEIAKSDFNQFFVNLKDNAVFRREGIQIDFAFCPTSSTLVERIDILIDEPYKELYLHFSGHGTASGINYGDWLVSAQDISVLLDHPKIKFCFFSSCQSSQLAKLVNERKIPVVLSSYGLNNLGNEYMIKFQKEFYRQLSEKQNYLRAFETAVAHLRNNEEVQLDSKVLERGSGGSDELEVPELNELRISFSQDTDQELCLVYQNIVERIKLIAEYKILLFYSDDPLIKSDFIKLFYQQPAAKTMHLITIEEDTFVNNTPQFDQELKKIWNNRSIKVFSIFTDGDGSTIPPLYKNHFKTGIYDHHKIDFRVMQPPAGGVIKDKFGSGAIFTELKEEKLFSKNNVQALFADDKFIKFLDEKQIDFSERHNYTLKINCAPVKKQVKEVNNKANYIRVFFGKNSNEFLINFLINYLRRHKTIITPNLIFDFSLDDKELFLEAFNEKLVRYFPEVASVDPEFVLPIKLASEPYTIIFRINSTEKAIFENQVKQILEIFSKATIGIKKIPKASYLFFISADQVTWEEDWDHDIVKTFNFSTPLPLTKEIMEAWGENLDLNQTIYEEEIIPVVQNIAPEYYNAACPSRVIKGVCDGFLINSGTILQIS